MTEEQIIDIRCEHKEKIKKQVRLCRSCYDTKYRNLNKERINNYKRGWMKKHREKIKK